MAKTKGSGKSVLDLSLFKSNRTWARAEYQKNQGVFSQGESAEAMYYIETGRVKITVISKEGKEAVIGILGPGDFFGEGCLVGQRMRTATARTISQSSIFRIDKAAVIQALSDDQGFSEVFLRHLLTRNIRIEEDLVDQLFNSTEKRLARVLLLLANYGKEGKPEPILPKISQETLAEIIGTTRPRVNFFMNKFRRLGFIEYNGVLAVHSSLMSVVLHD